MSDVSTAKSVFALAVVVGCFVVLWPKIFYPMMRAAFRLTTSSATADPEDSDDDRLGYHHHPPHYNPSMGKPIPKRLNNIPRQPGRPQIPRHPGQTVSQPPPSSQGGIMGMIMPVYSIGVILFFFYTVFKVMSKKPDKTPKVKNFNMDPEHRKFVFSEEYDGDVNLKKQNSKSSTDTIPEEDDDDNSEDYRNQELIKLQKRLAGTEAAMAKILKQMGDASQKLCATVPTELNHPLSQNIPVVSESDIKSNILPTPTNNECVTPLLQPVKIEGVRKRTSSKINAFHESVDPIKEVQKVLSKAELKVDKMFEGHHSKDSTPDMESYEVVGSEESNINRKTSERNVRDSSDSDISIEECTDDSHLNTCADEGSSNEEIKANDEDYHLDNNESQGVNINNNSSFECISSNENTPVGPDKDINAEVAEMDLENRTSSTTNETKESKNDPK